MNKTSISILLGFLSCLFIVSCQQEVPTGDLGELGTNGMVVSAHPEASRIGVDILKQGGNAMDAACAVEFALSVCYPAAGNIGGGGFWIVRNSDNEVFALDYREKAPALAHRDMYLDSTGSAIRGLSTSTILASGVPGTVAGMVEGHTRFGLMSWEEVVQPAIDLAINGFKVTAKQAGSFNSLKKTLSERNEIPPALIKDEPWKEGDLFIQKDLGETLMRIRDKKREGFYGGETAELIVSFMEKVGGLISKEDLKNYQAIWREPISGSYRNHTFYSMPPPSSGGIALYQLLYMQEAFDTEKAGWNTTTTIHHMVEAEKRVYADRSKYLGDPDYFDVPLNDLLNKDYLDHRISEIDPERAATADEIRAGDFNDLESEETTHYSVVDRFGNAVAATTTLNGGYGCKIVVEGAGFFLNNEMDDFSIKPGVPNMYGLVGGEANAIMPGKRMLSSMTPTIITKGDDLKYVVGTPGGSTIITSVFQTILNVIDHNMTMKEAVTAGRFHHQWLPEYIRSERQAIDSVTMVRLKELGHELRFTGAIGRVDAIKVWPDGTFEGGADPRGDDTAIGY